MDRYHGPLAMVAIALATILGLASSLAAADTVKPPQRVDQLLTAELIGAQSGKPAPRADDETFLRRVHLDLVGQLPSPEQVIAFTLDPDPGKRTKVVNRLLDDPRFGRNWASYWRDVIFYRRTEDRAVLALASMQSFLVEQINRNTAWNDVAQSFVTAKGDVRENGATGLIMAQGGRPEDTVAEISRIFMGIQIQCAQCHDHPTDRWKREQFHELAAFFPRVAIRPNRDTANRSFSVVADDGRSFRRTNNNNRYRGTPEHFMSNLEDPSDRGTQMQPVFFVTGEKLPLGTPDDRRRDQFADWLTGSDNPWFARATVNRIWAELVGEGFYEPVDDMGPDRECSAPQTLDYLAEQFVSQQHDMKWLFRTVMETDAYQRKTRSRRGPEGTPFLASCAQRLRSDQLYNNLTDVLGITEPTLPRGRQSNPYAGIGGGLRGVMYRTFGYDPSTPREEVGGSIPQALMLMNSPFINQAISARRTTGLGKLLAEIDDDEELTVELYLRSLAREPTAGELKTCLAYVREVDNRGEAFEDLMWALINSTEFLHRR